MMRKRYLFLIVLLVLGCAGSRKNTPVLGAEDQYILAKREYEKKHWNEASLEFQKLIYNYPGAAFMDSAQFLLGMCYYQEKDYPAAVGEFKKILISFSQSHLADDAAFLVAYAHYKDSPKAELDQKNTLRAIEELKDFLEEYPLSEHAEKAQGLLLEARSKIAKKLYKSGRLYFKLGMYEAALIYLKEVMDKYSDTRFSAPASFHIAESYFKQKKYDLAELEYLRFLEKHLEDKLAGKVKNRLKKIEKERVQAQK